MYQPCRRIGVLEIPLRVPIYSESDLLKILGGVCVRNKTYIYWGKTLDSLPL